MQDNSRVRVRFAPSPTGFLHVGGLRTALYNYLFARHNKGVFVLRIEDTDRTRFVEGAVDNLLRTLEWSGLEYDEGPRVGGPYGPYVQSERLILYKDHVTRLLDAGFAYRCFCTPERLDELRKRIEKSGVGQKYDRHCLALPLSEVEAHAAAGTPHVIRMKIPDNAVVRLNDVIRGEVEFTSDRLDDQVLLKSDGYPTYHLANVVDDHLMNITHVIRGEEWLSSTPKHVLLYQFFNWSLPTFAHLPLLLNPDRTKLSKRQGDVAVEEYRAKGYLAEALINFVALLGWNPGDEQEIFSKEQLVRSFSLNRVNKAGAIFNTDKLTWLTFQHLRALPDHHVLRLLRNELERSEFSGIPMSDEHLTKIIRAMKERASFVRDFIDKCPFLYAPPTTFDPEVRKKRWKVETPTYLARLIENFSKLDLPGPADYENALARTAESLGIGNGQLIHAVRLSVSGCGIGPGLYEMLDILGKDETIRRIRAAINTLT